MHSGELEIDAALVRRLLEEQFSQWADLPLHRVLPAGTENAVFRLGEGMSVRLARRGGPSVPGGKELDWLATLAPLLPLEVPIPIGQGRPSGEYHWYWDVHTWVGGETMPVEALDAVQAAHDLAQFVGALHRVDPDGAPHGRGVPLAERDDDFRRDLVRFDGGTAVVAAVGTCAGSTEVGRATGVAPRRPGHAQLGGAAWADKRRHRLGLHGGR